MDALGDCIRYGIYHLFPIKHDVKVPDYVTDGKFEVPGQQYRKQGALGYGTPSWDELLSDTGSGEPDYCEY
jgi:hypothetical protein